MLDIAQLPNRPADAGTSSSSSGKSSSGKSLDYDAFLKLMIAQMKNQDPTEPMDTAQYMGQLASFSQVEQGVKTNAKLDSLLASSALSQAENAIGRTVTSADGTQSGSVTSVRLTEEGPLATLAGGGTLLLQTGVTIA